jgi:LPPG:FO 2-phospho-L-lactate transferase
MSGQVVVLAGGTGGAKLARGMLDVVGASQLTVVANPGDDIEIYGAYVAPDPDLITFWLGDLIDTRGWGLDGDTFAVMDGLRALGVNVWFNLGDRDLAIGLHRAEALQRGVRLTDAHRAIVTGLGVAATVLPATDIPVRTHVRTEGQWVGFQEFMVRLHGEGEIEDVEFRGVRAARPSPEVLDAVAEAEVIVIGPSNPIISIGPILAVPGMREAILATRAPVVAVSPLVAGAVLKGPTAAFMRAAGHSLDADGIAAAYAGLLAGLVSDEPARSVPTLETDVLMSDAAARRRLAEATLEFARALA